MDKAQSSPADGSETLDNSSPSSNPLPNDVGREAADYLLSRGVTVSYEDVFQHWMLDEPRKLVKSLDDLTGITSKDDLSKCFIPSVISTPEKWQVNDKPLALLQDVCTRRSESDAEDYVRQIRERTAANSVRQIKFELPVLRTDNEIDLRKYKREISNARKVHLCDHHLPLDPCDDEQDEGLEFPPQSYGTDMEILQSVEDEKIQISKASFQTLLTHLKADWTQADQDNMLMTQVKYKGLIPREPITPPLTPRSQTPEPFIPDEETCAIPQPSDPSSCMSDDLRKAEDRIFDDDGIEPTMSMSDIEQALCSDQLDEVDLRLSPKPILKRDDLKVDVPLLSATVHDEARLSPNLENVRESIPQDNPPADDLTTWEPEEEFDRSMKETAARLIMEIEQERLDPLDGTIRVDVPVVDFSIPEPEWSNLHGDSKAIFRSIPQESAVLFSGQRWSRKLVEESKMVWKFWTARDPKPALEEPINEESMLENYLGSIDDAQGSTSSDYVSKKPGLRILDDTGDKDEEELQPSVAPQLLPQAPNGDWMALIKKRKLFLDGQDTVPETASEDKPDDNDSRSRKRTLASSGKLLAQEEDRAAATMLDTYLQLHAPKKLKLDQSPFFKKPVAPPATNPPPPQKILEKTIVNPDLTPTEPRRLMPCPAITPMDKPPKLLVAVNIPRGMIQHLEHLLPGLHMIDRDYNEHNSSIWIPGSVSRSKVTSTMADEADLIASPSTGILLTTMIKVRQKPLPNAQGKSVLSNRVENVAARYERLTILVSEDNRLDESMNDMSAPDATGFADFQAFTATLPCETMMIYVGGGTETLAMWVAAIVSRYAAGSSHLQQHLAQSETPWELFLRRAGMNVYAAQVVLGMLRPPEGEPLINHERAYGLPAFVKMTEEQRYGMFETVLGGRRVLGRVGKIIDAKWGSVAGET